MEVGGGGHHVLTYLILQVLYRVQLKPYYVKTEGTYNFTSDLWAKLNQRLFIVTTFITILIRPDLTVLQILVVNLHFC